MQWFGKETAECLNCSRLHISVGNLNRLMFEQAMSKGPALKHWKGERNWEAKMKEGWTPSSGKERLKAAFTVEGVPMDQARTRSSRANGRAAGGRGTGGRAGGRGRN